MALAVAGALSLPALASAAQINIAVVDNRFSPKETTINLGDTVTWTNTGSHPHTVTADNGAFDSQTVQPGQSFSFTFNNPGGFPYHCTFHGGAGDVGMAGRIIVSATTAGSAATGTVNDNDAARLEARVQALLAQVTALQQQLTGQQGGQPVGAGASQGVSGLAQQAGVKIVDSSACPKIGRSLKPGSSGDDVRRLQQFLARDGSVYPEGIASGFYGSLTEAAVRRWQAKFNIVSSGSPEATGFGVVGPRTAAAISLQCSLYAGGGTGAPAPVGGYIQVSPISGNAPLAVNIQATVNTTASCTGATYDLSWGDGTATVQIPVSAGNCHQLSQTYGHTYQYGGVYLATLSALGHTTTATITVYGPGAPAPATPSPSQTNALYGPFNVAPHAGGNPLAVTASFDLPSSCAGYDLSWGDGTAGAAQQDGGSSCASGVSQKTLTHQYAVGGSYDVTLKRGAALDKIDTASISITQ